MHNYLERNLHGYGPNPPDPQWPDGARVAVSFVLNYEEGGENTIVNGDPTRSEERRVGKECRSRWSPYH